MTDLHEILYCSVLANGQSPTVVGQIVSEARARNPLRGITGLLVFDGIRFCQHIEGPREAVLTLASSMEMDVRHADMRVVYDGALFERRYQRFDMGLAEGDDVTGLAEIYTLDGQVALDRFLALRSGFDVNG
ncbi:BLUF domain-containing protein [Variovorax ginsengisoli]|uniref:BLUF domain-containing protein n=1 Tax=Variovorax ginsengisoli TaxID=363844 RepID=A0ABT9S4X1_9BURK|nr:BLUF domain-containing protein [Variovorax ginsengisoli]MDP9898397.1 hypothetical protein [Variovorax ginsengisoli]